MSYTPEQVEQMVNDLRKVQEVQAARMLDAYAATLRQQAEAKAGVTEGTLRTKPFGVAVSELRRRFNYDPDTGIFTRAIDFGGGYSAGQVVGSLDSYGYLRTRICGRFYKCHHLAWAYVTGAFPDHEIDHINGNRADNRIGNLRMATREMQTRNTRLRKDSTTGVKNVTFHKRVGKYRAHYKEQGKVVSLGYFSTIEEAAEAINLRRHDAMSESAL